VRAGRAHPASPARDLIVPRSLLRPLRQRLEALLLACVAFAARVLPFPAASALGASVGGLAHRVLGRRRRIAVENLRASLGDRVEGVPAEELARRAFVQLGRSFLEFLWLQGRRPEELLARVTMEGYEPLEARAREGKGAVLVTGHFGNWELLGASLRARGCPVRYLLPPQSNPASDARFDAIRRSIGIEPVKIGFGMRDALRALRSGDFLAMLPDQDARRIGVHVPFFGRPASTHTGPARLAVRSACPIAVAFLVRTGGGRFHTRLEGLLSPRPDANEQEEVLRLTREVTLLIENAVRRHPDHWYWLHRRWKTPPPRAVDPAVPASA
jgi:KDO2-lipid IV(A) lauroyltransferase